MPGEAQPGKRGDSAMLRILTLVAAFAAASYAQTTGTATLRGAVNDSTGAAVAGAKVSAMNAGTSFVYENVTGADGGYYLPYLIPGEYRLTVEAPGFKKYVRDGITLRTAEQPRIDAQLEVGAVTESLTVSAAAPLLETETAASGQILEGDMVVKIPVMQKFVHRVLLYMPGTTNINGQHINGQRQRAIGYTWTGSAARNPWSAASASIARPWWPAWIPFRSSKCGPRACPLNSATPPAAR